MKIGLFTDRYLPQTDGVSVAVEVLRAELEKLGHEVYVVAPKSSRTFTDTAPRIIRLPAIKGLWGMDEHFTTFFWPRRVLRRIDRLGLDVYHIHSPAQVGLLGVYCALHRGKPLINTYHTDYMAYTSHYASRETLLGAMMLTTLTTVTVEGRINDYSETAKSLRPRRSIIKWHRNMLANALTQVHNRCDVVIAPSEKIRRQLDKLHASSPTVTLASGINKIPTTRSAIRKWREKLDLQETDKVVLFVGRISTEKNLGLLIKAFERVAKNIPEGKLVLAGPGETDDVRAFQAQARATKCADRIIFTGEVKRSELGALYGLAAVLGFPSLTDTQGLVINEAAAAGLPIVMVDREITQVVIDGENGYVAKASARDFGDKLQRILSDPKRRQAFSKRSCELARECTAEKQVKKLVALYGDIVQKEG